MNSRLSIAWWKRLGVNVTPSNVMGMANSTDILLLGNQIGRTATSSRNDLTRQDKMMMMITMTVIITVIVIAMSIMKFLFQSCFDGPSLCVLYTSKQAY